LDDFRTKNGDRMMDPPNLNQNELHKPDTLLAILNVLFKRGKIIRTFFISVIGVVAIASFLITPVYRSSSKLLIEREVDSEKALLFQMSVPAGYERYNWIQSEMDIIMSHPVAVQLVKTFRLDELGHDEKPSSEAERIKRFERAVKVFKKRLVVASGNESNVLEISYEDEDPQLAKSVVEKVIETYLEHRSMISDESESYEFFEEQMRVADGNLRELEQRQSEYKQSEGVISQEAQMDILLARLADYEKSLTEVRTKRISKEASLAVIREHMHNGWAKAIPVTESSDSPSRERHIAKLKGDLLDMELQRELLLQKFTPKYEEVINLDNQIKVTKEKIEREISEIVNMEDTAIRALKAEEKVIKSSIENTKKELQEFTKKEYELAQLSRGIEENREVYSMFLRQREEARISLAKLEKGVRVRVISPAFILPDPVKPKKMLNVLMSVFLGLVGGLGLAFLIEYFDHSVTSPTELEKLAGINFLGSIREIDIQNLDGMGLESSPKEEASEKKPFSSVSG
jgi:uncharacterized protein involved in exopolysaccharide biosynthesis